MHLKIKIFLFLLFPIFLQALELSEESIKKMIGRMLVVGFNEEKITKNSQIYKDIKKYNLGGVILFDRYYTDRNRVKNIRSPKQLKKLTSSLQKITKENLIISVDQEGGKVARLKEAYGFNITESAKKIGEKSDVKFAKNIYASLADELSNNGINCDFAPVVDLSVNENNRVIFGLERSYGKSAQKVVKFAEIFIDELKKRDVISVLKHFPGHGSSLGDSHKGFVDVTQTWSEKELEPYSLLIAKSKVDMIMTAHVFNKNLDEKYPATLSRKVNTEILRNKLGFKGLIISDDLQMKAISKHYSLKETVTLAINAGVNMLLFGNQLANQNVDELVDIIYEQIKNKQIDFSKIEESNTLIAFLKKNEL